MKKKKTNSVPTAKGSGTKPSFIKELAKHGHALTAVEREFLSEKMPNDAGLKDGQHVLHILEFWSKPYHDIAIMFKQHQCDRGFERRILDVAREDVQRLLQILDRNGVHNAD